MIHDKTKTMKKEIQPLSDEEMASVREYCEILRDIHNRLVSEGWTIKDGVFTNPAGEVVYERSDKA